MGMLWVTIIVTNDYIESVTLSFVKELVRVIDVHRDG